MARCVRALVAGGIRVEEATLAKAYEVAVDLIFEEWQPDEMDEDGPEGGKLLERTQSLGRDWFGKGNEETEEDWQGRVVDGVLR